MLSNIGVCQGMKQLPWSIALQTISLPSQLESIAHQLTCIHIHNPSRGRSTSGCTKAQTAEFHYEGGRETAGLTLWNRRSEIRRKRFTEVTSSGCHLCLPSTPPRPILMKPDCLFCSISPLISSAGAWYKSLMVTVTNKSATSPTFTALSSGRRHSPSPDGWVKHLGSEPGSTDVAM